MARQDVEADEILTQFPEEGSGDFLAASDSAFRGAMYFVRVPSLSKRGMRESVAFSMAAVKANLDGRVLHRKIPSKEEQRERSIR